MQVEENTLAQLLIEFQDLVQFETRQTKKKKKKKKKTKMQKEAEMTNDSTLRKVESLIR
jgi:hypothetical protein